ncbi:MAG: hypothetical protein AAF830_17735 [Pseudomonadota bacterium]
MITKLSVLKTGLVVWVLWHLVFAYLSTFAPQTGAEIVGWSATEGWSEELIAMSKQYGMVMLLLAGVYLVMLTDPLRYLSLIWVAVGEQALGIAYGAYIFVELGQLTPVQLAAQSITNAVLIAGMLFLWMGLRQPSRAQPA